MKTSPDLNLQFGADFYNVLEVISSILIVLGITETIV